jgi:hypothetical protein
MPWLRLVAGVVAATFGAVMWFMWAKGLSRKAVALVLFGGGLGLFGTWVLALGGCSDGPDGRRSSARIAAAAARGVAISAAPERTLSPDGKLAFDMNAAQSSLVLHDAVANRVVARCDLGEEVVARSFNASARWVAATRVLIQWGAGTYVALARLYATDCTVLLTIGGPAIGVSPGGEFLLVFPPEGVPLAESGQVTLFDLTTGARVAERSLGDARHVIGEPRWLIESLELDLGAAKLLRIALPRAG